MIKYFSTGYLSRYILLFFLLLIIWIPSLLVPSGYTGISSYLFDVINIFTSQNLFIQTGFAAILTIFTALLINKIAVENGFTSKVSTLTSFLYIILASAIIGETHNNPVIWINFIMVFVLSNIFKLPYAKTVAPVIFNASFLLGVASLFYSQLYFIILFIWASIIIHRVLTWRNITISLIGISLPYVYLLTWFFFNDQLLEDSYVLFNSLQIDFSLIFLSDPINIIVSTVLFVILMISAFGIAGSLNEKNINLRKNLTITFFYLLSAFLIVLVFSKSLISPLLLSIPSSLIISYWLSNLKNTRWFDIALLIITILIILNEYLVLFFNIF